MSQHSFYRQAQTVVRMVVTEDSWSTTAVMMEVETTEEVVVVQLPRRFCGSYDSYARRRR